MKNGWRIFRQTDSVADSSTTYSKNRVDRLHSSESLDIGRYFFRRDNLLYIDPPSEPHVVKSYTVLAGRCRELETHAEFGAGDILVVEGLNHMLALHFLEDSYVMVHSRTATSIDRFKQHTEDMLQLLVELQTKDNYTKEHSDRVLGMAKLMGLALDYHSKRIFNLNRAALFHDIGKVFIDDAVLNKPSRLDDDEFRRIQEHVLLGRELVLSAYDEDVYEIIHQHHERLDGHGYPRGLNGEQIMQEAKIIAICDSYDAMTTDRVYKKGKSQAAALSELRDLAGSHYDAELVELFASLISGGRMA